MESQFRLSYVGVYIPRAAMSRLRSWPYQQSDTINIVVLPLSVISTTFSQLSSATLACTLTLAMLLELWWTAMVDGIARKSSQCQSTPQLQLGLIIICFTFSMFFERGNGTSMKPRWRLWYLPVLAPAAKGLVLLLVFEPFLSLQSAP